MLINILNSPKTKKDDVNHNLNDNHLKLNASQNILGKPGFSDMEGAIWACYDNGIPVSPDCPLGG
ncbi:hypothetical protein JZM40_00535 [Acinetobacter pittii]|uniref:hypothetical protein n=1 Tax=Acinetobacter pittii TaxID=48296 RepID=UPI00197E6F28|nr:hypothetical protein [Acinetobacter pittii]MBN6530106.1 hypothetical protein [Acinetobacter pittii]